MKLIILILVGMLLCLVIAYAASPTGITLIMGAGSGTSPTGIDLIVGLRGEAPINDCTYVSGDWIIDDGSDCVLSTVTDIGGNHFSLISGSVKIESTGGIRAKGCFINADQAMYIAEEGRLFCSN